MSNQVARRFLDHNTPCSNLVVPDPNRLNCIGCVIQRLEFVIAVVECRLASGQLAADWIRSSCPTWHKCSCPAQQECLCLSTAEMLCLSTAVDGYRFEEEWALRFRDPYQRPIAWLGRLSSASHSKCWTGDGSRVPASKRLSRLRAGVVD